MSFPRFTIALLMGMVLCCLMCRGDEKSDKLIKAVKEDNWNFVEQLIKDGANPNALTGDPLIFEAAMVERNFLIWMLLQQGISVESSPQGHKDATPLTVAVSNGHLETVELLLGYNATINSKAIGLAKFSHQTEILNLFNQVSRDSSKRKKLRQKYDQLYQAKLKESVPARKPIEIAEICGIKFGQILTQDISKKIPVLEYEGLDQITIYTSKYRHRYETVIGNQIYGIEAKSSCIFNRHSAKRKVIELVKTFCNKYDITMDILYDDDGTGVICFIYRDDNYIIDIFNIYTDKVGEYQVKIQIFKK